MAKSAAYTKHRATVAKRIDTIPPLRPFTLSWLRLIEDLALTTADCDGRALNTLARYRCIAPTRHGQPIRITAVGYKILDFFG